jgi:hypothetical protein
MVVYLFAFELWVATDGARVRLRALLPICGLLASYFLLYALLQRGVALDGLYQSPTEDPPGFVLRVLTTVPALAGAWVVGALSHRFPLPGLWLFGPVFAGLLVAARPFMEAHEWRVARFGALGALLSLLPAAAGGGGERLLFMPALGASLAAAALLVAGARALQARSASLWRRSLSVAGALALSALQLVASPVCVRLATQQWHDMSEREAARLAGVRLPASARDVIVLAAPAIVTGPWGRVTYEIVRNVTSPPWWITSMGFGDHLLKRIDQRTFELSALQGSLTQGGPMFRRTDRFPLRVGQSIALANHKVVVLGVAEGQPTRVSVELDRSLDDPSLAFLAIENGQFNNIAPPPVGESRVVHSSVLGNGMTR